MSAFGVANTTWVDEPDAAGSLACRTEMACWASVPGMVTASLVLPPLADAMRPAPTRMTSHADTVSQRLRKHHRASRYRKVDTEVLLVGSAVEDCGAGPSSAHPSRTVCNLAVDRKFAVRVTLGG